jgi:hypothetical protein
LDCEWFNLAIWGFRPRQQFEVAAANGRAEPAPAGQTIETDGTGVGKLAFHPAAGGTTVPGGLKVWSQAEMLTVRVDDLTQVFDLAKVRGAS